MKPNTNNVNISIYQVFLELIMLLVIELHFILLLKFDKAIVKILEFYR